MAHAAKMLGGMFIFRRIAASDVAADQAQAQMDPAVAHLNAFGANVRRGVGYFNFIQVFALFGHYFFRSSAARSHFAKPAAAP